MQHNHCRAGPKPSGNNLRDELRQEQKKGVAASSEQRKNTKIKHRVLKGKNPSCNAAAAVMHCRLVSRHGHHPHPHQQKLLNSYTGTGQDRTALRCCAVTSRTVQIAQLRNAAVHPQQFVAITPNCSSVTS